MMMANALTRLVGEKGKEMPIDRYVRLKNNISQWYQEVKDRGLSEEEIKIIEPYYLPASGCPTTQEKLMLLCMDKNIAKYQAFHRALYYVLIVSFLITSLFAATVTSI